MNFINSLEFFAERGGLYMRKLKIAVLSAETGQGHTSVMEALKEELNYYENVEIDYYPSFYEDLMISNKILSNFYNFLMVNSIEFTIKKL